MPHTERNSAFSEEINNLQSEKQKAAEREKANGSISPIDYHEGRTPIESEKLEERVLKLRFYESCGATPELIKAKPGLISLLNQAFDNQQRRDQYSLVVTKGKLSEPELQRLQNDADKEDRYLQQKLQQIKTLITT